MIRKNVFIVLFLILLAMSGCSRSNYYKILTSRDVSRFCFSAASNDQFSLDIDAQGLEQDLILVVPRNSDMSALVANFEYSGYAFFINDVRQISGESENDFSTPLTYRLYSYDGRYTDYRVSAEETKVYFESFRFSSVENSALAADVDAEIGGNGVWFYIPHACSLSGLVPSFDVAGPGGQSLQVEIDGLAQTSAVSAVDFRTEKIYSVSSSDGSRFDYRVSAYRLCDLSFRGEKNGFEGDYRAFLQDDSITVEVPENARLSSLIADFSFLGDSITFDGKSIESGKSTIDFSSPVTVKVAVTNGPEHSYTVTVVKSASPHNPDNPEDPEPAVYWTVSFDSQGGSTRSPQTVAHGERATQPAAPVRNGYTFAGWYTEAGYINQWNFANPVAASMTLYARWNANTYTVSFNVNYSGGTNPGSQNCVYGSAYGALPTPARSGYNFGGWYLEAGCTNPVTAASFVTTAADHTLYAQWSTNSYSVSFDVNYSGGTNPLPKSCVYDSAYGTLPTPEARSGYTFGGWYLEPALATLVTDASIVTTAGNHTLYAKWNANTYTLTLYFQNSSEVKNITVTFGSTYDSVSGWEATPTHSRGYTFLGWFTQPCGGGTQITGTETVTATADHELYADWQIETTAWSTVLNTHQNSISKFSSVAAWPDANDVYSVGMQNNFNVDYSSTYSITPPSTFTSIWLKYDFSSPVQWARTLLTSIYPCEFTGIVADFEVYAVGYQDNGAQFNYYNSCILKGGSSVRDAVIVQLDEDTGDCSLGSVAQGLAQSQFNAVAAANNSVAAVGYQKQSGTGENSVTYGNAPAVQLFSTGAYKNAVVVLFNGYDLGAEIGKVVSGNGDAEFFGVARYNEATIFAAGYQTSTHSYDYKDLISVAAAGGQSNAVLAKYYYQYIGFNHSLSAQWVKTTTTAQGRSVFNAAVCDNNNNVYAVGSIINTYDYRFTGMDAVDPISGVMYENPLIVKYDTNGNFQWARTVTDYIGSATMRIRFNAVTVDLTDDIVYAVGLINGQGSCFFSGGGTGGVCVSTTGSYDHACIVAYGALDGRVLWASSTKSSRVPSVFNGVTVTSDYIVAAGYQNSIYENDYGGGPVTGVSYNENVLIVRYKK